MIWVNGERYSPDEARVSAADRGLTLADGIFETMLVRHGVVFRQAQHLARLDGGLALLQFPPLPDLRRWLDAAIQAVGDADASVRLTVTRGAGPGGLAPPRAPVPTVIVAVNPPPQFPAAIYEAGLTARIASGRINERSMTAGLKTLAYTDAIAAWLEAQRHGADEAIFLDSDAHCSEATASNLFMWTGDVLVTPPCSCGALPGITRAAVMEIARPAGMTVAERAFALDELLQAREVFLTSSLRGLAPVSRIDGRRIGDGKPGECYRELAARYAALVQAECRGSRARGGSVIGA